MVGLPRAWPTPPFGRGGGSLLLVVGDGVVILTFLAIGLYHHHVHPWVYPVRTLVTAAPFVVGWAVVATVAGCYGGRCGGTRWRIAGRIALLWPVGVVLGAAIRAQPFLPGGAPPEFVAVVVVGGATLLVPWRVGLEPWVASAITPESATASAEAVDAPAAPTRRSDGERRDGQSNGHRSTGLISTRHSRSSTCLDSKE